MGHRDPMTIANALRQIQNNDLILPAIQREFVWKPSQIVRVFDSIMREYPVGSFLSWKVQPENLADFKFYGFLRDYSAYNNKHNPVLSVPTNQPRTAVLDGQQRLTSLYIGLCGSYAYRTKNAWSNRASSFPVRQLHLNLLADALTNDAGLRYDLRFLTPGQVNDPTEESSKKWFPVREILGADSTFKLTQLLPKYGIGNDAAAVNRISSLWEAVHQHASLQFYEEDDQDIDRVLDIFVRVNSGGTVLSKSDLLMSIATAQWHTKDARAEVHGLVDELNGIGNGFEFMRDTVLKAGLVLSDISDIGFRVKNFSGPNMARLEQDWEDISDSLKVAVGLLSDFGLSGGLLTADSVLIPVAYYVHARKLKDHYRFSASAIDRDDRFALRSWVLRSLIIRGVWGSGLDTLLRDLREVIKRDGSTSFPLAAIESAMAQRGKSLAVTDELVDDILGLPYGGGRTWAVLATIFDHVDTQQQYHVDHVLPKSLLDSKRLKAAKAADGSSKYDAAAIDELIGKRDLLPNLELLPGLVNISKSATAPDEWVTQHYPSHAARSTFVNSNALPEPLPHTIDDFLSFFEDRRKLLAALIRDKLKTQPTTTPAPVIPTQRVTDNIEDALAEADSGTADTLAPRQRPWVA